MGASKNFNLFLMDGEVTGRIKCTLSNWTGLAYKIPSAYLNKCKDRQDLKQSGVYFLFGEDDAGKPAVYIGQASVRKNGEGVLFRVAEHLTDKFYFSEVVILTTQNNSFGPTEISYLENKFKNLAIETGRYVVKNNKDPNPGNVTEEKESELEEFVDYSRMVLGVLGYKIFVPLLKAQSNTEEAVEEDLDLYLSRRIKRSRRLIEARCKRTSEGFVVLAGSQIEGSHSDSIPETIRAMRQHCQQNGEIEEGILTKNLLFQSPSYAACFVLGMRTNGRTDWKTADGITLKRLEEMEL